LKQVRRAGLLKRRPVFYTAWIAANLLLLAAGVGGVRAGWRLLVAADHAAVLAVAFAQNGFLTRDAGHRQVFRSRRANHVVGLVHGNLAVGSAFGWWVDKHSSPPCAPQSGGLGPDIGGENLV